MGMFWREGGLRMLGKKISSTGHTLGVTKGDREPHPFPNQI